uniref:DDE-1 domain-containing protein n=1 Tax=Octopus bimaculoides TaxID=37653 RepID=A0A0L8HVM5_OCTBM
MEFMMLLVKDNADGHSLYLYHQGVQVEFVSVSTTSFIKPMDQGVICAFKTLYAQNSLQHLVDIIDSDENFKLKEDEKGNPHRMLEAGMPECVQDYESFSPEDIQHETVNDTVKLAMEEVNDMLELTKSASKVEAEASDPEEEEDVVGLAIKHLSDLLRTAKKLQGKAETGDPYMVRSLQFENVIDAAMQTYKTLFTTLKKRRHQLPMTMFLMLTKKALHEDTTSPKTSQEGMSPEEL